MKPRNFLRTVTLLLIVVGILLANSAKPAMGMRRAVALYTHNLGGTFNIAGVAIAKVVSSNSPIKMIVKPTSGPGFWLPLLNKGEGHIGITNALDAGWAWKGFSEYGLEKSPNIRMLLPGGEVSGSIDLIVRKDSNIHTIADLKGKRVAGGYKGAPACHRKILAQLRGSGLTYNDVIQVPVADYLSGLRALREGRADAVFGGSYISARNREINSAIGIRVLPIVDTSKPENAKIYDELLPGLHSVWTKKKGVLDKDQLTISQRLFNLLCYKGIDDDTVREIVHTLYTHYAKLPPLSSRLKSWVPEGFFDPDTRIPYHSGTIKYYKEIGVWTTAAEKRQKELLSQTE
ncbi:TAXI family TRAP transporter solute-binding subunit [Thermodesulfobacteriota bacterium]